MQELREKAESYEKYKSLFRRVIGKVARSKGFRKVARAVATFSMMFALASCEAGVATQPQESAAVDFIDEIDLFIYEIQLFIDFICFISMKNVSLQQFLSIIDK